MQVNIDTSPISVDGLDVFTEFTAISSGVGNAADSASSGVRVDEDSEHVWIDPARIVAAASAAGVPDSWTGDFERMCGYAQTKGWLDERGWIRAHVVAG
ncbi:MULTISPECIES: hypothetical protein [Mycobacteriaceae]|uniref:hypothetical protein n=1 Tax=Mycobacteriaceae TaxID=1762 RepID=UPI00103C8756|nr:MULTISPECIES: hypothetical protein [Mycobacteriaceae]MCA4756774.1 hypothetical protein [Mycolicibacterium fortuitum]MDG5770539.1 hypothetical protein [Mycolicibacterium fortuitum]MDG5781998.1 hypothetical protein [Mycolicibacterium fortuitum]NOQ60114.1 hypothetical protein [Mycolicibacterium fortuitum]WEV33226.1 hypothetical protein OMF10_01995 [Mycolicibacterium fortuitum]